MTMLAETVDAVIGIDTHRDHHEAEIADPLGRPLAVLQVSNDSAGYAALLAAIAEHAPGPRAAACVEGTRSYGIGLARALAGAGITVIEAEQPARKARRGKGKSDPIDAHLAVLHALRLDAAALPAVRADGDREALRILLGARHDLTTASTARSNRLRALLLTGDDHDRRAARGTLPAAKLTALARRRPAATCRAEAIRHAEIRRLALALRQAGRELAANRKQLHALAEDLAPGITATYGIGPVSAAQAIVSFSHPGRCRTEAAFAALAGTSPIPASSGRTTGRHRLNHGGDRALNAAIHTIALTRMRSCPRTRAYITRRTADGKTTREIRRCLKRYIARELYRTLTRAMTTPPSP